MVALFLVSYFSSIYNRWFQQVQTSFDILFQPNESLPSFNQELDAIGLDLTWHDQPGESQHGPFLIHGAAVSSTKVAELGRRMPKMAVYN